MASHHCVFYSFLQGNFSVKTLHHTGDIWLLLTVYFLMIYKTNFKRNRFITLITLKWFPLLHIFL